MIKKLFIILLIISFIFIFSSCKNSTPLEKETSSKTMTVEETTSAEAAETSIAPETTIASTIQTSGEKIINIPAIEGLIFDTATNIYFAESRNPY